MLTRGGTCTSDDFADMAARVRAAHAGLVMLTTQFEKATKAATPTKIAEFLTSGRPIVVSRGVGDVEALIAEHQCGVVVRTSTDDALTRAAGDLLALLDDGDLGAMCRTAAEHHFDLERGVDALIGTYRRIVHTAGRRR